MIPILEQDNQEAQCLQSLKRKEQGWSLNSSPEIKNIPQVLNPDKESLWARQPGVGFTSPRAIPERRADRKEKEERNQNDHFR